MWSETGASIRSSFAYGRELNSLFWEIIDDYGLEHLVYQPTRQGNILDIILISDVDMITNVDTTPGISDHGVILLTSLYDQALYLSPKGVADGPVGQVLAGPLFIKVKTKLHFTKSK